jgi:hypothetical protein
MCKKEQKGEKRKNIFRRCRTDEKKIIIYLFLSLVRNSNLDKKINKKKKKSTQDQQVASSASGEKLLLWSNVFSFPFGFTVCIYIHTVIALSVIRTDKGKYECLCVDGKQERGCLLLFFRFFSFS